MEETHRISQLLDKYLQNDIRHAEFQELVDYFGRETSTDQAIDVLQHHMRDQVRPNEIPQERLDRISSAARLRIDQRIRQQRIRQPKKLRRWLPYAAAVIIFFAGGYMIFNTIKQDQVAVYAHNIQPGTHRATLTLSNGQAVSLDETQNGITVSMESIAYYNGVSLDLPGSEQFVLTTPKGGTYQVTLPDGSMVWLNAASSLTYPSKFDGQERVVKLEGEAYFDVKTMTIPFKVITDDREVNVLGTEFNISAYRADDDVRITLVEGKVSVSSNADEEVILKPGQQAFGTTGNIDIRTVNTESYTAWKDGYFSFDETPLNEIMKQISRWYDAEVVYDDPSLETVRFSGSLSRYERLSHVLDRIAFIGTVQFEIRDRQIIVKSINQQK